MKKTVILGITGGMGSGKSTVANFLRSKNIPVIDADSIGHELLETGSKTFEDVVNACGHDILDRGGNIDRKLLGQKAFKDKECIRLLESIMHPAIAGSVEQLLEDYRKNGTGLVAMEAALLFEAGFDSRCDIVLAVCAPVDRRIERIAGRDGLARDVIRSRLLRQWPQDRIRKRAAYVLENDTTIEELKRRTLRLLEKIMVEIRS